MADFEHKFIDGYGDSLSIEAASSSAYFTINVQVDEYGTTLIFQKDEAPEIAAAILEAADFKTLAAQVRSQVSPPPSRVGTDLRESIDALTDRVEKIEHALLAVSREAGEV
jgi:hypothetical protein